MVESLRGCRILYTRSKEHHDAFLQKIARLAGEVYTLPLLDTEMLLLSVSAKKWTEEADILLFTSANAVRHLLAQYQPQPRQTLVAVGKQTAAALPFAKTIIAPPPYNSEALLRIWRPYKKKIAVIAAPGGRTLLADTLGKNNTVQIIYSYRRFNPSHCYPKELPLPHIITIASRTTLDNLCAIIPQSELKLLQYRTCVAAISASVACYAAQQLFQHRIFAKTATETDQIVSICHWWNTIRSHYP